MRTGRFYRKYSTQKRFGKVEGFNFGVGIAAPPLMTAWCYYIDGLLIDTGIGNLRNRAFELISDYRPEKIFLTHHHEDHSGNAGIISRTFNIPVYAHPYAKKKLAFKSPIMCYQHLMWGKSEPVKITIHKERLETDNYCFTPIHTPGHSKDHTVLLEKNNGWLFSGDLFLGSRIKFFRKDEIISEQIDSLKKILRYDFEAVYCAHNPQLEKGKECIRLKLDFLENLAGTILDLHKKGLSEKEILDISDKKKDTVIKLLTQKNVSFKNMVRSILKSMT